MRRFTVFHAVPVVAAMACNPSTFSDLEDQTWVDARGPAAASADKQVFIGWAPRQGAGQVPQFLVFGDDVLTARRFVYDQSGDFERQDIDVDPTLANIQTGTDPLFARGRTGVVVAALPEEGTGDYLVIVNPADSPVATDDDIVSDPFPFNSNDNRPGEPETPRRGLTWVDLAVSDSELVAIEDPDDAGVTALESFSLGNNNVPRRCIIDSETILADFTTTGTVGAVSESLGYVVGTTAGLYQVRLPETPTAIDGMVEACSVAELSRDIVPDGLIAVDDHAGIGNAGELDIAAAQVGFGILILPDLVTPTGDAGTPILIEAPSAASSEWGRSYAIGDFDGDGGADLAVGDATRGVVEIFDLQDQTLLTTLEPFDEVDGYGKSVASVPFGAADKDLLVVGNDDNVLTYFRILDEGDSDPR